MPSVLYADITKKPSILSIVILIVVYADITKKPSILSIVMLSVVAHILLRALIFMISTPVVKVSKLAPFLLVTHKIKLKC